MYKCMHVHGVATTKRHDIKIWPRKHLQYIGSLLCIHFLYASHYHIQLAVHVCLQYNNTTEMIKDITLHCYQN